MSIKFLVLGQGGGILGWGGGSADFIFMGAGIFSGTPRPATEPRDAPTRNFHQKYRKNTPAKILEPQKIPPKYQKIP